MKRRSALLGDDDDDSSKSSMDRDIYGYPRTIPDTADGDDASEFSIDSQAELFKDEVGSIFSQETSESLQSVNQLWNFCETMPSAVKLVLPDELLQPFYLPSNKYLREKTPLELQREERRMDLMTARELSDKNNLKRSHHLVEEKLDLTRTEL